MVYITETDNFFSYKFSSILKMHGWRLNIFMCHAYHIKNQLANRVLQIYKLCVLVVLSHADWQESPDLTMSSLGPW